MLHSRYSPTPESLSVVQLLDRIHRLQVQKDQNHYLHDFISQCLLVIVILLVFLFSQCPSRIYNAYNGPFHLNLDEFITHWNLYSGNTSTEGWSPWTKEYLQIDLGEDKIDDDPRQTLRIYYRHPTYAKVLYTFHRIKAPNLRTFPMQLMIKLPTDLKSNFHQRLPYRFEFFHADTLKCIARQIGIVPEVYQTNSTYVQVIEEIYNRNATDFNMKVILKCGILIGYFYDCATEKVYHWYSNEPYIFTFSAAAFDSCSSYSPYMTYFFSVLLSLWCIQTIFRILNDLVGLFWCTFRRYRPVVPPDIQNLLKKLKIDSIQVLDYLLMRTLEEDNYYDRLFLIQKQYLAIFYINLNERNPNLLSQFHRRIPFTIINIDNIIEINAYYAIVSNGSYRNDIPLPLIDSGSRDDMANWLHGRLMIYCDDYRHRYTQEALRAREEEQKRRRLAILTAEEENIQRILHSNDIERILDRTISASPRFIAQVRLEGIQTMQTGLSKTTCVICCETIRKGQYYSQWPCAARHMFHHLCMLELLRRQNQCPLCRHAVEGADLLSPDFIFNMMLLGERNFT